MVGYLIKLSIVDKDAFSFASTRIVVLCINHIIWSGHFYMDNKDNKITTKARIVQQRSGFAIIIMYVAPKLLFFDSIYNAYAFICLLMSVCVCVVVLPTFTPWPWPLDFLPSPANLNPVYIPCHLCLHLISTNFATKPVGLIYSVQYFKHRQLTRFR